MSASTAADATMPGGTRIHAMTVTTDTAQGREAPARPAHARQPPFGRERLAALSWTRDWLSSARLGARGITWEAVARVVAVLVTALAIAIGVALRLWLLFHRGLNADEASVGIMAKSILNGHFNAFFAGQSYGGVEPYLVAVMVRLWGASAFSVKLTAILVSAGSSLLVWRIALRLVRDPFVAALAGALSWVAPLSTVADSTVEYGFRSATLFCGLGCILVALRILDGHRSYRDVVGLGLLAGLGWWASPEVAYLLVPAVLLGIAAIVSSPPPQGLTFWLPRIAVALVSAVVAEVPWLWANVGSHFKSLNAHALPMPAHITYLHRLDVFFDHNVPMLFNLAQPGLGHGVLDAAFRITGFDVVWALVALSLALCLLAGGRSIAIVVGIVAFPFLFAIQPDSWFWSDGRYSIYCVPLLVLAFAVSCNHVARIVGTPLQRRRRGRQRVTRPRLMRVTRPRLMRLRGASPGARMPPLARALMSMVVATATILSLIAFHDDTAFFDAQNTGFFSGWGNPDLPAIRATQRLEAAGVTAGYAFYWVAYDVDFYSSGHMAITPLPGPTRFEQIRRAAEQSRRPAWVFVAPHAYPLGLTLFGTDEGPDGLTPAQLVQALHHHHIRYRTLDAGALIAIVPDRRVAPARLVPS